MASLRLLSLVFGLFLGGQNTNAIQVLQHPETLSGGTPIERELKGGETHRLSNSAYSQLEVKSA
jgi:hypothetical protein